MRPRLWAVDGTLLMCEPGWPRAEHNIKAWLLSPLLSPSRCSLSGQGSGSCSPLSAQGTAGPGHPLVPTPGCRVRLRDLEGAGQHPVAADRGQCLPRNTGVATRFQKRRLQRLSSPWLTGFDHSSPFLPAQALGLMCRIPTRVCFHF